MTSKDLSIFNSLRPFSIGFDDMFDQFENMLGNGGLTMQSHYPPYNIRKTGKDNYAIEVALAGFNKDDVEFLDSISLQFSSFSFQDSIWISKELFFSKLPVLKSYIENNIVKKSLFYQIEDSLELYLLKINKSVYRNDIAPLDYIKPILKQIILTKKKLNFVSKLEQDLSKEAIENKELEIYEMK